MRAASTFAFALAFLLSSLHLASAQGSPLLALTTPAEPATPAGTTMVVTGRVESPAGPLVGAVVAVDGKTYQKAVTNVDGQFRLTVPATTEALRITASYAGYRDVSATVQPGTPLAPLVLTEVQEIKLSRKLQLDKCLKTAHKEIKRELRQMRRG